MKSLRSIWHHITCQNRPHNGQNRFIEVTHRSNTHLKCVRCNKIMESIEHANICLKCGLCVALCQNSDCGEYIDKLVKWSVADAETTENLSVYSDSDSDCGLLLDSEEPNSQDIVVWLKPPYRLSGDGSNTYIDDSTKLVFECHKCDDITTAYCD